MGKLIEGKSIEAWQEECPVLRDIIRLQPTFWMNEAVRPFSKARTGLVFTPADVDDAAKRLERFRPYISLAFSETAAKGGLIESDLQHIPLMQQELLRCHHLPPGRLFVKLDSHLPISGSVKARGGIYEILKLAESIAVRNGLLTVDDTYEALGSSRCRDLFSRHSIVVGSTGNLGLSIGIIGITLGFAVTVHMSGDAAGWKKETLRTLGVEVVEHDADYGVAVAEGRAAAEADPRCHFVDDENSRDLFLGYAVAGERLRRQLAEKKVVVDKAHPLFVYLPCGVGGAPGGITYGLKLAFGDNVHCFFVEPTQAPAILVGLATGLHDAVAATDFGVKNQTIADGLAVARPSGLVSRTMQHLLSGVFTVADEELYRLLSLLARCENIFLEPSALAGFSGYCRLATVRQNVPESAQQHNGTHLVWATGGSMVPRAVWQKYNARGLKLSVSRTRKPVT